MPFVTYWVRKPSRYVHKGEQNWKWILNESEITSLTFSRVPAGPGIVAARYMYKFHILRDIPFRLGGIIFIWATFMWRIMPNLIGDGVIICLFYGSRNRNFWHGGFSLRCVSFFYLKVWTGITGDDKMEVLKGFRIFSGLEIGKVKLIHIFFLKRVSDILNWDFFFCK